MPGKTRFASAENTIRAFFLKSDQNIYTLNELKQIHDTKKYAWHLAQNSTIAKFLDELLKRRIVTRLDLSFEGYLTVKNLFAVDETTIFEIASAVLPRGYLSHYTAAYLHGLTTQVPNTIYLTFEHAAPTFKKPKPILIQKNIDSAFSRPQKISGTSIEYKGNKIVILNGLFTNRIGVFARSGNTLTNIERTLIDMVVRPAYSGGVSEILNAYKAAKNIVSINKLMATIKKLDYIYPYHQAIGFYMDRAGYNDDQLAPLKTLDMEYDFYLTYGMEDMAYSKKWRLYYPLGI